MKKILGLVPLFVLCSVSLVLALNPSRTYKSKPEKYGMKYEEKKVTTSDGATLNVWYFPCPTEKTTKMVLICHNGEGNMGEYLERTSSFISAGYNVIAFDYRGYGESSEFAIEKSMYLYPQFATDVLAMIDFVRKSYVQTFNVYGFGIGAGLSVGIGANRPEVKKVVADGPFLSLETYKAAAGKAGEQVDMPFGYNKKYEPLFCFENNPAAHLTGILYVVGEYDKIVTPADIKTMVGKASKISKTYLVKGSYNPQNFDTNKNEYFKNVLEFLNK